MERGPLGAVLSGLRGDTGHELPELRGGGGRQPEPGGGRTSDTRVAPNHVGLLGPMAINLYQFKNMTVNWTVAACTGSSWNYDCSWQMHPRSIRVVPEWYVSITLDSLDVHNDCDAVTAEDWRVRLAASGWQGLLLKDLDYTEWPSTNGRGSRDVDTGCTLAISSTVGVTVHESDSVTFGATAIDCDNDGLWTFTNVFRGRHFS